MTTWHNHRGSQDVYNGDHCGEGILNGEDMRATDGALAQRDLSAICSGVNAFSHYERGEVEIPLTLRNLLRLPDRYPDLLNEAQSNAAAS